MADDLRVALADLLRKAELERDADFLREGVRLLAQQLMELEVSQHLGAEKYVRAHQRADGRAQWLPRADLGHAGGHHRPARAAGA